MSLPSWFRSLRSRFATTPAGARSRQRLGRCLLNLERLEDRTLLAADTATVPVGFLVTNTHDSGDGSLRQAILDANATAGPDVIRFAIPGSGVQTITPMSALPALTDTTFLDGWSQGGAGYTGSPLIELDGSAAGQAQGLIVVAPDTTVRGLVINRFAASGIYVASTSGTWIYGYYIGLDPTGTDSYLGNATGVSFFAVSHATVGSNADGVNDLLERNVISGGYQYPVGGLSVIQSDDITVRGNYFGTDASGTQVISTVSTEFPTGNGASSIFGLNSSDLIIIDNLVSGGANAGILLFNDARPVIQGNRIGTNAAGTAALGFARTAGIWMDFGTHDALIGGTAPGAGNLISGNFWGVVAYDAPNTTIQGNFIGTDITGTYAIPNQLDGVVVGHAASVNVLIGGTAPGAGNLISGNGVGIGVAETNGPVWIEGNYVGTDITGRYAIGNGHGVYVRATSNVTVGGSSPAARNLISGNANSGIAFANGSGNLAAGNYVGTEKTGTTALANGTGVALFGSQSDAVIDNLISGNGVIGVFMSNVANNVFRGNRIGTNAAGTAAVPNVGWGVFGYGNNTDNLFDGNLISGNTGVGFEIAQPTDQRNVLQGNYIGNDITGTVALGNGSAGVRLYQAPDNTVVGNVISSNGGDGIAIGIGTATGNVIQGNAIGTDASGTFDLGNDGSGIYILIGASDNTIGGIAASEGNRIAFNRGAGVLVDSGTNNSLRGNAIYGNGGLGIELGVNLLPGVTPNDAGDGDDGPNRLQNFPVITLSEAGLTTHVAGSLSSTPNTTFMLDFYANPVADPSGFGEGRRYLGTVTVTTDAGGDAGFDAYLAGASLDGEFITATATDPVGNTSEFSGLAVAVNQAPTAHAGGPYSGTEGGMVALDGTGSSDPNQPGGTLAYAWDLDGDGVFGETGAAAGRGDEVGAQPTFSAAGLDGPSAVSVALRVTDAGGLTSIAPATIQVSNAAPTATLSNDGPVVYGRLVTASLGNAFDASLADSAAGFRYTFSSDGVTFSAPSPSGFASFDLNAGTYTLYSRIYDRDGDYTEYSTAVRVDKADAALVVNGYTGVYDGQAHGLTGSATGVHGEDLSGLLDLGASRTDAGVYAVDWFFAGDDNYNSAGGAAVIDIGRATPTVTVVGGSFVYDGQAHPALGTVTGVDGASLGSPTLTYSYTDDQGHVVTSASPPVGPGYYTVTATFAGDHNYQAATATAVITIAYEARSLTDFSKPFHAGRTIPIKLQLTDAAGHNLSSPNILLTALRLVRVNADGSRTQVTLEDAGGANPGNLFRYDAELGGYIFNLSTKGLGAGAYEFVWGAAGDPTEHVLRFTLR